MTAPEAPPTLADAIEAAGGIPPERIVLNPPPGTATEADVLALDARGLTYELIDGTLVRKMMGVADDRLAVWVGWLIANHVHTHNLGVMGGSQALLRLAPGLVRMPDVCFTPWEVVATESAGAFQDSRPALVIEVLSPTNTRAEMMRKLTHYAAAGIRMAWIVDGRKEVVEVYPDADRVRATVHSVGEMLDGGPAVPGFNLPVATIFEKRGPSV